MRYTLPSMASKVGANGTRGRLLRAERCADLEGAAAVAIALALGDETPRDGSGSAGAPAGANAPLAPQPAPTSIEPDRTSIGADASLRASDRISWSAWAGMLVDFESLGHTAFGAALEGRGELGTAGDPLAVTGDGSLGVYHFPSGSSQIKLEIGRNAAAITLGEGTPEPETDFDVGLPTDVEYVSEGLFGSPLLPPIEGFTYYLQAQNDSGVVDLSLLYDVHVRGGVIRLFYSRMIFCATGV